MVLLVAAPAFAAPLGALAGLGDAEAGLAGGVQAVGADVARAFPVTSLDTTLFFVCQAKGRCALGPFPATSQLSFGIVPFYSGTVTMSVRVGAAEKAVFACSVPGSCALVGTGAMRNPFRIVGDASPDAVGEYVVWVSYG